MIAHINNVAGVGPLLVAGLQRRGIDARMVMTPQGDPLRRQVQRWRTFRTAARDADVAHVHYALYAAYLTGVGVPMVVHCHGSDVVPNLDHPVLGPLTRRGLRRAALILYSTANLAAPLLRQGFEGAFLPNPVEMPDHIPEPEANTVLLFSRLDPVKGAATQIEAGRLLAARGVTVRVVKWGELGDAVAADPGGIEVLERVSPDAVPDLIARHEVIVGQLRAKVCGLSELQAMAMRRPVIMPYEPWPDEPVAPPVVPAEGAEAVAAAAMSLLADRDRARRIGDAGRSWVEEHHSTERVVDRLVGIYEDASLL